MRRILIILTLIMLASFALEAQSYSHELNRKLSNGTVGQLAPVPYVHQGDTGIVFMSNAIIPKFKRSVVKRPDGSLGSPMNIYFYDQTEKGKMKNPRLFEVGNNSEAKGDIGPVSFSGDYTMLCIVQPQKDAADESVDSGFGGLFFAEWIDGEWSDPVPFTHNDPEVNFSTPCLSKDGQILFFAAEGDLEGALGGMDIYYSMNMGGTWSAPVNLGERINTPEHDIFPYYYQHGGADNQTIKLYFSSKGHNAGGGTFDLFFSVFYEGEWLEPLQVPSVNTAVNDELSIYFTDNANEGMFSRRGDSNFNIRDIKPGVVNYEPFPNAEPMKEAHLCYRIYDRKIDTVDPVVFEYEWVIRVFDDTIRLPGHEVKYCFPGPGDYSMSFNVTNKLTDTTIYNAAHVDLRIPDYRQPIITADHDTAVVGEHVRFSAAASKLPDDWDRVEYFWDFDDGTPQIKGEIVDHPFARARKYRVVLGAKKVLSRSEERLLRNNDLPESAYKLAVFKDIIVVRK